MSTEAKKDNKPQTDEDPLLQIIHAKDDQQLKYLKDTINSLSNIATLPVITLQVMKLLDDPDAKAKDLQDLISNDPALGAKVLKVVNSPFYGIPRTISSIERAIISLGLKTLRNIAIAASLTKMFKGKSSPHINPTDIWNHSIAVAIVSKQIADHIDFEYADDTFLIGLLHNLGIIIEYQAHNTHLIQAVDALKLNPEEDFLQLEYSFIGANHQQFGAMLSVLWGFPVHFAYAIGYHHNPLQASTEYQTLPAIINVADYITKTAKIGFNLDSHIQQPTTIIKDLLNIDQNYIDQLIEELPDLYAANRSALA